MCNLEEIIQIIENTHDLSFIETLTNNVHYLKVKFSLLISDLRHDTETSRDSTVYLKTID